MNGYGSVACGCDAASHECRFIVLTGGPGAGKTAILESLKRSLCEHIAVVPESASIIFGGGFWRRETLPGKKAAQRAIFHVQAELEDLARSEAGTALALCDRGTLDGLAYWPDGPASFFAELGTTKAQLLARYETVIHLATPTVAHGYNHPMPLRRETAEEAHAIDRRILDAWDGHPRRIIIGSRPSFLEKAEEVIALVRAALPPCCHSPAIRS